VTLLKGIFIGLIKGYRRFISPLFPLPVVFNPPVPSMPWKRLIASVCCGVLGWQLSVFSVVIPFTPGGYNPVPPCQPQARLKGKNPAYFLWGKRSDIGDTIKDNLFIF
jgi:putative component of membrane protein insertase Oxa1/YidC/SpoIIIJ protein YidD